MSTAETGARAESRRLNEAREPWVLPQWAFEIIRYVFFALFGLLWRIRYTGTENIPPCTKGGLIVVANHQTYLDPFWVSPPIKRPMRYLAWNEAFRWPVLGRLIELLGAWPLQIEGSDPTAIRRSLQYLRGGGVVVIFPEGGRARPDGEMSRFKPGAARMALEAGVAVLPVTIRGGHRVWPRGWRLPRPGRRVEIIYHPLYTVAPEGGEDTRCCARRVSEQLATIVGSALKK